MEIVNKIGATKKPTGLAISRENMKFTVTWKKADADYNDGVQIGFRTNLSVPGIWTIVTLPIPSDTDYTFGLSNSNYYPNTDKRLTRITIRIRGKREQTVVEKDEVRTITDYTWSAWEEAEKIFDVNVPNFPTLTAELDDTLDNRSKFSWKVDVESGDSRPFVDVEWQTILRMATNETDGSKLEWSSDNIGWATGTSTNPDSYVPVSYTTEETEYLAANSYTRWVRVRSRGPAGVSAWRYAKHVYAKPYKPTITGFNSSVASGVTTVTAFWTVTSNPSHPINSTTLQYVITTPAAGGTVPGDASWTDGPVFADTAGTDAGQFTIEGAPGVDEVLFVRVKVTHDRNDTYSEPKLVRRGTLAAPTIENIVTDDNTHRATITVEHNSDVPDSRIAVVYRDSSASTKDVCIGIIAHDVTELDMQCPNWSGKTPIAFGVYEFQGTTTVSQRADGVLLCSVTANWASTMVWQGGNVPAAPDPVSVLKTGLAGEVLVKWVWTWIYATQAEISWSKNRNAWESTEVPQTFIVDNLHAGQWRVSGLSQDAIWYFRVRLARTSGNDLNWGPYSEVVSIDMSEIPERPVLTLSKSIVRPKSKFIASWTYESADGTKQSLAEIRTATVNGSTVTIGGLITKTSTSRTASIDASRWAEESTHYLVVRVTSSSGRQSEWSDPVPISVAKAATCEITATSLVVKQITGSDGNVRTRTCAVSLPISVTVSGATAGGTTTVIIERREDYIMDRPDGKESHGYKGEIVAIVRRDGAGTVSIGLDDLIKPLDDGAMYWIRAIVEDRFGQTAMKSKAFEVYWNVQATSPRFACEINENGVMLLTLEEPPGVVSGNTYDVYRLSADMPELIAENIPISSEEDVVYVDPYPVLNPVGGYRVVFKTKYGDYIKSNNQPAWKDIMWDDWTIDQTWLEENGRLSDYAVIDFGGDQARIDYNLIVENAWEKDFQATTYLGGSIQGDWNPAVKRSGTVSAVVVTDDTDLIQALRRLAMYTGICHIRTPEGSSYSANVDVTESQSHEKAGKIAEITLSITRVDQQSLDCIPLEEYEAEQA